MPLTFTLLSDDRTVPPELNPRDIGGEDISLLGGDMTETAAGDLGVVIGKDAARQSVERELPVNPGVFVRRQDWGAGLSGMLFKGATPATRDRMESRARARCLANPRISRVNAVSSAIVSPGDNEGRGGVRVTVDVDTPTGRVSAESVVRPPGVR